MVLFAVRAETGGQQHLAAQFALDQREGGGILEQVGNTRCEQLWIQRLEGQAHRKEGFLFNSDSWLV